MQVTVESTGTLERRLRVELPAESIEKEVDTRLKSVGRTVKIKGFRPGKVPPKVVRQRYGKQIRQEVLAELMQKSYSDAVVQENLNPAGAPQIEQEDGADGEDFAYIATLEVMPEVELEGLDKIKVTKHDVTIGDADLADMLEKLRAQKGTWKPVERKSRNGDRVVCDFSGELDGEKFEGGQGSNVPVVLGEGQMLPDFEKGLTGVSASDEKTFKVKFPKDYGAEELAGKKVDFSVVIHSIEEVELPPLDDAFAEMFNVEEGGLDKLKTDVRENMEREAEQKGNAEVREQVLSALLEANPIEIPQTLKTQEMYSMRQEAMHRLGIEDPDQAPPVENFAEQADKRVRLGLLMRQLIADQEITLDEEGLRAHVEQMVAGYDEAEEMANMYMTNPQVRQQIEPVALEQLAVNWLVENSKVTTKSVTFTDYMSAA